MMRKLIKWTGKMNRRNVRMSEVAAANLIKKVEVSLQRA
jgi:hypothetical protein